MRSAMWLLALSTLSAHAPPTPIPVAPFHVLRNSLVDATGTAFVLRGVEAPGLETGAPPAAMTPITFQVIQQRWNMNAVRLPVSVALWKRDGAQYLTQVAAAVSAANSQRLVVVLAAYAPDDAGLPTSDVLDFWRVAAAKFKDTPGLMYSLYNQPSTRNIPGAVAGVHRAADWTLWLQGGALTGGRTAIGMQALVDAIRAAGGTQVVAAPAFHDALGFQGLTPANYVRDANVMYEIYPGYDQGLSDDARDQNFGFLTADVPVMAGAWGASFGVGDASCQALPANPVGATKVIYQTMAYFERRGVSWMAADFAPGSLIRDFSGYAPTSIGATWNCATADGRTGIGQFLLLWMTGDANGFGSIDASQIASAAGGFPGPVAPGELISIYGQGIGPEQAVGAAVVDGRVAASLGEVQVLINGVPAPVLMAWYFQVNVQVPYEMAGQATVSLQAVYRGLPSNTVQLAVAASAPGIFTSVVGGSEAEVLNQDGTINGAANPAARGSVVSIFCTGGGQTSPSGVTGAVATLPLAAQVSPVAVALGGRAAEVLYAGPAPGLVGVTQVNARVPDLTLEAAAEPATITVSAGGATSRSGVALWVK